MDRVYAFVDESGNHDLDIPKAGASNYFIVLAIIVKAADLLKATAFVEQIRKTHFQSGEIKSSSLKGRDHRRRIKILNEILLLDFKFYSVALDKAAVNRDSGLQYKKSFFKFANGLLYREIFKNHIQISVIADDHGTPEFIAGFEKYIDEYHKPDLFWQSDVKMVASSANVLVQLADFIVGTIAKIYEGKSNPALNEAYLHLVKAKALNIQEWPTKFQTYFSPLQSTNDFDQRIHEHSLARAEAFLEANQNVFDTDLKMQIVVLRRLVFLSRFDTSVGYVMTQEILSHLREEGFSEVSEQAVRSNIVAKLRDKGVLIASSTRGYKIPRAYSDLVEFVQRVNGLVLPLLERLRSARNSYLHMSQGEVDLLTGPSFPDLVAFIEQLEKTCSKN